MDSDREAAREDFASLLYDLPATSHALVQTQLPDRDILVLCQATALDAGERWLVHEPLPPRIPEALARQSTPFVHSEPQDFLRTLEAAVQDARDQGVRGVFLTILPDHRVDQVGAAAHAASERALGPQATEGARVVCVYSAHAEERVRATEVDLDACHSDVFSVLPRRL